MSIDSHPPPDRRDTPELPPEPATHGDIRGLSAQIAQRTESETQGATSDRHAGSSPEASLTRSEHILKIDPPGGPADEAGGRTVEHVPTDCQGTTPEPGGQPDTTANAQTPDAPSTSDTGSNAEPVEPSDQAERREKILDIVTARNGVETDADRATVSKAFDAVRSHLAPAIVHATSRILEDCKELITKRPDTVVVFLGRDAHTMALAAQELDPERFARHCAEAPISRCLADSLVQDLETNADKSFPEIDNFRDARDDVDPDQIPGSRATMTRFLESRGIPVGIPGANIVLVDTSFKGSVQSLLSVTYPDVNFQGKYLAFSEAERDPHAASKQGYLLHQAVDGTVVSHDDAIPADLAATLSDKDTVLAIEQSLRGPYSKAERFGPDWTPEQHFEAPPTDQINPLDVSPDYLENNARLAVMDANQMAVGDYAREIAQRRSAGQDVRAELAAAAEAGLRQVRSWATRSLTDTDPDLAEMMNSIVRRSDKHIVGALHGAIEASGLDPPRARDEWRRYQQLESLDAKQAFLTEFHRTNPARGAEHE
ncbi:hypothetical protein ACQP1G_37875 [Nocardia sp. CA-107356]|uniref:hypothetical protein n=1 Tax=Nocardia sp. CA-107356 TaxID=3239972 RepID=UPI003D916B94